MKYWEKYRRGDCAGKRKQTVFRGGTVSFEVGGSYRPVHPQRQHFGYTTWPGKGLTGVVGGGVENFCLGEKSPILKGSTYQIARQGRKKQNREHYQKKGAYQEGTRNLY